MRICAYVQERYAKQCCKNECADTRQFVGLRVVMDSLERAGYRVEWAGIATVHKFDIVLVSITSDCDWWTFVQERMRWQKGSYRVICGGAGVLHVSPFLPFADYFSLGRGENSVVNLVRKLDGKDAFDDDSVIDSAEFSADKIYHIRQEKPYPYAVPLAKGEFCERTIGCNHKCLFCGYTWQRDFVSPRKSYAMDDDLFGGIADKERAMLDMENGDPVDLNKLRTTAIDGMSERLRFMVNKKISNQILSDFLRRLCSPELKPHSLKLYCVIGYPTETADDWREFRDVVRAVDSGFSAADKRWRLDLACTPFRPMPATPLACAPACKENLRGKIASETGRDLPGSYIFSGNRFFAVEGFGTDGLSTVMLSMLAHRGSVHDTENIMRLCRTPQFWSASSAVKEATLTKYFDMDTLFGEYTPESLPSRYLRTFAKVEKMWARPAWKEPWIIKPTSRQEG